MTRSDWTEFCDCIGVAAIITQRETITQNPLVVKTMFQCLAEFSIQEVKKAVKEHLNSDQGHIFPTPSHIIRRIKGTEAERKEWAWQVFIHALEKYGYYENVMFPYPAFHYVIQMLGGWIKVSETWGNMTNKELTFHRNEFMNLYTLGERKASFNWEVGKVKVPRFLKGFYSANNSFRGYAEAIPQYAIDVITRKQIAINELIALEESKEKTGYSQLQSALAQGKKELKAE